MRSPRPNDTSALLLVGDPLDPHRLLARPRRRRDILLARILASSLDRRLATGDPPEAGPLLAVRAQALVSPDGRRTLARHWEHLLAVVDRQPARHPRRVPLCCDHIVTAEPDVRAMLAALVRPVPVPARGVAMASVLLRNGAGPLYNSRSPDDLVTAVRAATASLSPSSPLVPSA